jgi:hypothetical protein
MIWGFARAKTWKRWGFCGANFSLTRTVPVRAAVLKADAEWTSLVL